MKRILTRMHVLSYITRDLHWVPGEDKIIFKIRFMGTAWVVSVALRLCQRASDYCFWPDLVDDCCIHGPWRPVGPALS